MITPRRTRDPRERRDPREPRAPRERREVLCADIERVADRAAWSPDPSAISEDLDDLADRVRDAVRSALTDRQRLVVEGYFFEGLSQGDLARRLGVSQQVVQKALFGTVRGGKRIGGALGKLRAALSPLAPAS